VLNGSGAIKGGMRTQIGDMREPGLVLLAEPTQEFTGEEGGRRFIA
jgi:hypothetical protein